MTQPPRPSSGSSILAWAARMWDYVMSQRVIAGPGIRLRQSRNGTIISAAPVAARPMAKPEVGAFWGLYRDPDGHTRLQGGSITGGHGGSASIADIQVIDASSGPVAADGQILYVQANCTATVADGVMLPGCVLNSATTGTGSTVPPNHSFTTTALTGDIYLEIGRWAGGRFLPSGPAGNLYADGCIGSFSVTRI